MLSRMNNPMTRPARTAILALAGLFAVVSSHAAAQVDCVMPRALTVSSVQGQVYDPTGVVVPGAQVTLVSASGPTMTAITSETGAFHFDATPGKYTLKVVVPAFQFASVQLTVGRDLPSLHHPSTLFVLLGLGGSYCPWVTTSHQEFQATIRHNNKRLKETVQKDATQK